MSTPLIITPASVEIDEDRLEAAFWEFDGLQSITGGDK